MLATRKGRDHFDAEPVWSNDGKRLAIVSHRFGAPQQIALFDADSGSERILPVDRLKAIDALAWVPGREALLVCGSETPANQFGSLQLFEVALSGEVRAITNDLNDYQRVSITADDATVAAVQVEQRSGIEIAPMQDGVVGQVSELFPISAARAGAGGLAWLDDRHVAHGIVQGETLQIVVTDIVSKTSSPLTTGASHRGPVASADGRTLVVSRDEGDTVSLWRVDPETGREERLTNGPFDWGDVVTPDGSWAVYRSRGEQFGLWKVPVSGGEPVQLAAGPTYCSGITRDGRDLLCLRLDEADRIKHVLQPLAGGEARLIRGTPKDTIMSRFGPDGRSITWLVIRDGGSEIWSRPLDGGTPRRLVRLEGKEADNFDFSPDGSRLAMLTGQRSGDVVLLTRASH